MKHKKIILGIGILLFLLVGIPAFIFFNTDASRLINPAKRGPFFGHRGCVSNPNPTFTHHPTDISKITAVTPPPSLIQGHLKAHGYLHTTGRVPVYAPADSRLLNGVFYTEEGGRPGGEYSLDFQVSCEIGYRFDHISEPNPEIIAALGMNEPAPTSHTQRLNPPIEYKAGDLIGYTEGTVYGVWDFGVYNSNVRNQFADNPEWNTSQIYITAVCPFDYFSDEMRAVYESHYTFFEEDPFEEFCDVK